MGKANHDEEGKDEVREKRKRGGIEREETKVARGLQSEERRSEESGEAPNCFMHISEGERAGACPVDPPSELTGQAKRVLK